MEDAYSSPTAHKQTKKNNFYPNMMRHKGALCKQVFLPPIHKFG